MSFSVSRDKGRFEWSGSGIRAVFTQWTNLWNWEIYRMIFDILRFNTFATDLLENENTIPGEEMSLVEYLDKEGYSRSFRDNYLIVRVFPIILQSLSSPHREIPFTSSCSTISAVIAVTANSLAPHKSDIPFLLFRSDGSP